MDPSFTDAEKRFVLAEMIKASQLDVATLVDFVRNYNVQPDWLAMQLPGGRNMHQCIRAAESMFNIHMQPPPIAPLKRKSLSDLIEQPPKRLAAMTPIEPQPITTSRNVNIQPRPSPTAPNGYSVFHTNLSPTGPPGGTGRKRGRPSKADKEAAQARASAFQPISYAPISPAPPTPIAPQPPSSIPAEYAAPHPTSYQLAPGPPDPKQKKKNRPASVDKSQPRALPDIATDHAEKSPAISNLMAPDSPAHARVPATQEAGRVSSSPASTRMPVPAMSPLQRENPPTPVTNTA